MAGPNAAPSELENPVPNLPSTNEAPKASGYFKDIFEQNNEKQASAPSSGSSNGPGIFSDIFQKPETDINPNAPSAGNLPGGLFSDVTQPSPGANTADKIQNAASITAQNIKDLGTNFLANLGGDPQKALETWQSSVGKKNAKFGPDGKTIYFRSPGEKEFRPVTKGLFDGIANFISQHSGAATFAAGALLTDGLGTAAGLITQMPEVAEGAGFLARAGRYFTPEAMGAAAASGAGGGVAQSAASSITQNAEGNPSAPGVGQSIADAAASAAVGASENLGASVAGGTLLEGLKSGASSLFGNRWSEVKNIYSDIKNVFQSAGMQLPESPYKLGRALFGSPYPKMEEALNGEVPVGAIDDLKKDFSNKIDVFVSSAQNAAAAADQKFPIDSVLDGMRQQMEKQGIKFKERSVRLPNEAIESNLPAELNFDDLENHSSSPDSRSITAEFADKNSANPLAQGTAKNELTGKNEPVSIARPSSAPWGERSAANVNQIVDLYNTLLMKNEAGGLSPLEVTNFKKMMQGIFDPSREDAVGRDLGIFLKNSSHDMTLAQKDILKQALQSSPAESQAIDDAYKNFSQRADIFDDLSRRFATSGAAEKVADDLIRNQSVDEVRSIKYLLSDPKHQPLWNQIKGNWFSNLIQDSSQRNILNPDQLYKKLFEDTPAEVTNMMFSTSEQTALKQSLNKLRDIPLKSYVQDPNAEEAIMKAVAPLYHVGFFYRAARATQAFFGLMAKNGPAADYMAGDGFLRMAQDAANPEDKMRMMQMGSAFKDYLSGLKKTYDKSLGYSYTLPVTTPVYERSEKKLGEIYGK